MVFTDGNAACRDTRFSTDVDIVEPAVPVLQADYWCGFPEGRRLRCAEALVLDRVAPDFIESVACNNFSLAQRLQGQYGIKADVDKSLFF